MTWFLMGTQVSIKPFMYFSRRENRPNVVWNIIDIDITGKNSLFSEGNFLAIEFPSSAREW